MAVKQEFQLSMKIDSNLQEKLDLYVKKYGADKSKVTKIALNEYLSKFDLPVNVKKTITAK